MVNLKLNLAGQHFPPQAPVAKKDKPGICQSGGFIVFKEEMSNQCEGVTLDKSNGNKPPHLCDESKHN